MRLLAVTMCVLVGAPATAHADRHKQARAARTNLKAGIKLFEKGEHDLAIEKLKIALALGGDASANYYLGRAYEAKDELAQAVYYLQTFLDAKSRKHRHLRNDAEKRVAALKKKLDDAADTTTEPAPEPPPEPPPPAPAPKPDVAPAPAPVVTPEPEPSPGPRQDQPHGMTGMRMAGLATLGAGVLLAGTGGYFAYVAHDRSNQLSDLFAGGATWDNSYNDLYDQGKAAQRNARILIGIGGAAAITGAVLVVLGHRDSPPPVTVSALPGGASVNVWCDF